MNATDTFQGRRILAAFLFAFGAVFAGGTGTLSLARVMGPPDCQGYGTTVARY